MGTAPAYALACALLFSGAAEARTFTPDDLLKLQQLGGVAMAPGGRWAVVQTFAPIDEAGPYDLDWWNLYVQGRLQRVDLSDGAAGPLLKHEVGCGYVAGPISPGGTRMAVSRLCGHAWELGIVSLADGATRWLGVAPEIPLYGREILWRDDDTLLVIAQSEHPVGERLGFGYRGLERLDEEWRATAKGQVAVSTFGSGRYLGLRPKASPKHLLAVHTATGAVEALATGLFLDLELSPNGRTVAVVVQGEDVQEPTEVTNTGMAAFRRRLLLVDLVTRKTMSPCPQCDINPEFLGWSASGDRLMVLARQAGAWSTGAYQIVDTLSGALTPITPSGLDVVLPRARNNGFTTAAAWLGDTPIVYARRTGDAGRSDWYAISPAGPRALTAAFAAPAPKVVAKAADHVVLADGASLWRVSLEGQPHRIDGDPAGVMALTPHPEGDRLMRLPPAPADLAIRRGERVAPLESSVPAGLPFAADETPLAATDGFGTVIIDAKDSHGVERLRLRHAGRADIDVLTLNQGLDAITPAVLRPIHHAAPDGRPLTSWLYLPPDLPAGAKAPLVVVPYPGDEWPTPPDSMAPGSTRLHVNGQVLAGAGYAVLVTSLPYVKDREPMDGLADQVLGIVDAAAAQAPVDSDRLAVWGHSYGGYTALALATQSPRFKAVIAGAPISNLTSFYGIMMMYDLAIPEAGPAFLAHTGWAESGQGRMNGPPWRDPGRYWRNSPISFVDKVTAPLMLIVGDRDNDPQQSTQMFVNLYRQDKDAVLLVYHCEGHVISSPDNVRDQYRRALAFLREHIGPPAGSGSATP